MGPVDDPTGAGENLGAAFAIDRTDGLFQKHQVPALFVGLARRQRSGRLIITLGSTTRTIGLAEGMPIFAMSTLETEHFGMRLVDRKVISSEQWVNAEALVRNEGIRFGQALGRLNIMTASRIKLQLDDQRDWIVGRCMEANSLRARFHPADIVVEEDSPVRLLTVIEDKIRAYDPAEIETLTERFREQSFVMTPDARAVATRLYGTDRLTALVRAAPPSPCRWSVLLSLAPGDAPEAIALTAVLTGLAVPAETPQVAVERPAARPVVSGPPPAAPLAQAPVTSAAPVVLTGGRPVAPTTVLMPKARSSRRHSGVPSSDVSDSPYGSSAVPARLASEDSGVRASFTDDLALVRHRPRRRSSVLMLVFYATIGVAVLAGIGVGVAMVFFSPRPGPASAPGATAVVPTAEVQGTGPNAEIPSLPATNKAAAPGEAPQALPDDNAPALEIAPRTPESANAAPVPKDDARARAEEIEFRLNIVRKLLETHNYARAVFVSHEILKLDRHNASAYRYLGIAYSFSGSRDLACEAYSRYLRYAGNPPDRSQVEKIMQSCNTKPSP